MSIHIITMPTEAQGQEAAHVPAGDRAALPSAHWYKTKPQPKRGSAFARTVQDVSGEVPDCATTPSSPGALNPSYFVPVSFAAKDWSVTPRRIRSLLTAKRLEGRREANEAVEKAYSYRIVP